MKPFLALTFALWSSAAFAADIEVKDIAANPASYDGQTVTVKNCLLTTYLEMLGGQCSTAPMNADLLVYIDADTLTAEGKAALAGCDVMDIMNLCLLDVTGAASVDGRGHPLIKSATVVVTGKAASM
jgi:hypothetical protein